jgi:hypothetical protein
MAGSCSKFFFHRHHSTGTGSWPAPAENFILITFSTGTGLWPGAAVNSFFTGTIHFLPAPVHGRQLQ